MDNAMRLATALAIIMMMTSQSFAFVRGGAEKQTTMSIPSAYDAVNSFGVSTHVTRTASESAFNIIKMLDYLGIKHVRTSVDMSVETSKPAAILEINAATGAKFNGLMPLNMDANYATSKAFVLGNLAVFESVEGQNEVNINAVTYNGLSAPYAERAAMAVIYADFKNHLKVYSSTLAYFEGRQAYLNDVALYRVLDADYCNLHAYPVGLNSASAGGMIYTTALNAALCNNKPPVVTETGAYTVDASGGRGTYMGAVTEAVQVKYVLNALLAGFKLGNKKTFIYELVDSATDIPFSDPQKHYGIFRYDLTPKPAATAIQNMIDVLRDKEKGRTRDLTYTIAGEGAHNYNLLMQKSDGSHVLALWREEDMWDYVNGVYVSTPNVPVTVTFDGDKKLSVYNPLVGKTPQVTYGKTLSVDTLDSPLLIKVEDI